MTHEQWMMSVFMLGMLQGQNEHSDEYQFCRQNGHCFDVEYTSSVIFDGDRVSAGMVNFQDVSERKIVEHRLLELTQYDQLTSLMNRATFQQYLEDLVAQPDLGQFCLMVLDIDKFKSVNESLGPKFGDKLLVSIANRIVEMQRPGELVARTGADEFAWLIVGEIDEDSIKQRAEDVIEALSLPHFITGKQVVSTVGLGIACYPAHGVVADELLSAADTASIWPRTLLRRLMRSLILVRKIRLNTTMTSPFVCAEQILIGNFVWFFNLSITWKMAYWREPKPCFGGNRRCWEWFPLQILFLLPKG
jgi:diguanylate cyclase (GGDEF)-like protein